MVFYRNSTLSLITKKPCAKRAGFIGGNFVLDWIAGSDEPVVNLDKLTYVGNLQTLADLQGNPRHISSFKLST